MYGPGCCQLYVPLRTRPVPAVRRWSLGVTRGGLSLCIGSLFWNEARSPVRSVLAPFVAMPGAPSSVRTNDFGEGPCFCFRCIINYTLKS